ESDSHLAEGATLPAKLLSWARTNPDHVAMRKRDLGRWKSYTWSDYADRATAVGLGLRSLGVEPGDRVAVLAGNRPAWPLTDLGVQGIGAIAVGIYPTSPAAEVHYVLEHSGAKVILCEDEEQADKVIEVRDSCPDLQHVVVVDPTGLRDLDARPGFLTFAALEALAAEADPRSFHDSVAELDPDSPAIIVYTSGTTGPPKGAVLSHRNLVTAARSAASSYGVSPEDELLSYLPLCHVAERLLSVILPVSAGSVV